MVVRFRGMVFGRREASGMSRRSGEEGVLNVSGK